MPCTRQVFGIVALGLMALVAAAGCGSGRIPAPTAYKHINACGGTFQCDYPEGWEARAGTGQALACGAQFTSGAASIIITGTMAASARGDIASHGGFLAGPGGEEFKRVPPVEVIHQDDLKEVQEEISHYKEEPHQTIQSALGDARRSEFTGTAGMMQQKIRGYRATILGTQQGFRVICKCPEGDWKALEPAFAKLIASLAPGDR